MDVEQLSAIKASIKQHEGFRDRMYYDGRGYPTVGWGHNLRESMTLSDAEHLLASDIRKAESCCVALFPNFDGLSHERQSVLIEMAFNLGCTKLARFSLMRAAILKLDWQGAADEMLASEWHKQVGLRAEELAERMREG